MQDYQNRRKKLLEKLEVGSVVIIPAASEVTRNADTTYPFRQNSDFYYMTGFHEPDAIAVFIKGGKESEYILFNRPKDPAMEVWTGARTGHEHAKTRFGANESFAIDTFHSKIGELIQNRKRLYWPIGKNEKFDAQLFEFINLARTKARRGITVPEEYYNIDPFIHEMRLIKSEREIAVMRTAIEITEAAHKAAMSQCQPGMMEYEIEAVLLKNFYERGSRFPAYGCIVAGGKNACTLHYVDNESKLKANELLLIDAGAEYQNYASDITRTFPISGKFTDDQKKLYEAVLRTQQAVIDLIRPGVIWSALQDKALEILEIELKALNIIRSGGNVKDFYIHTIGHWLGLDVHDAGAYKVENEWRKLEAGMVLTVEPGVYIPQDCEKVEPKWRGIGIRIEDDVLVTVNGCEVLSAAIPKQVDEIEKLMQGKNAR